MWSSCTVQKDNEMRMEQSVKIVELRKYKKTWEERKKRLFDSTIYDKALMKKIIIWLENFHWIWLIHTYISTCSPNLNINTHPINVLNNLNICWFLFDFLLCSFYSLYRFKNIHVCINCSQVYEVLCYFFAALSFFLTVWQNRQLFSWLQFKSKSVHTK